MHQTKKRAFEAETGRLILNSESADSSEEFASEFRASTPMLETPAPTVAEIV